jgi:hypothetical protein
MGWEERQIMIAEALIVLSAGATTFALGYLEGRSGERARARKRQAEADKAERILNELPEGGPLLNDNIFYCREDAPNPRRSTWSRCPKCPWIREVKFEEYVLCACDAYEKTHFHWHCNNCRCRAVVRTLDDIDKPAEPLVIKPQADPNACKCGSSDATSAELPSGVPAWKCRNCGVLRPKLVGGVTPVEMN